MCARWRYFFAASHKRLFAYSVYNTFILHFREWSSSCAPVPVSYPGQSMTAKAGQSSGVAVLRTRLRAMPNAPVRGARYASWHAIKSRRRERVTGLRRAPPGRARLVGMPDQNARIHATRARSPELGTSFRVCDDGLACSCSTETSTSAVVLGAEEYSKPPNRLRAASRAPHPALRTHRRRWRGIEAYSLFDMVWGTSLLPCSATDGMGGLDSSGRGSTLGEVACDPGRSPHSALKTIVSVSS
ncbi:hypothetical protein CERSUDRAFT_78464 [Gelatoporia subvermispora B]|uniref:Uncharacterized protein n=1 Tax=Ceriporiopsis subvermispora (strain B) TaxID=914234 RepID=M2QWZ1_CERS8|nr:hypothetical protein CERSUDRAFT_78464 [Gelatoporia subvermispora B]